MGGGCKRETVDPAGRMNDGSDARLHTGKALAKLNRPRDRRILGNKMREGVLIDVISDGCECRINGCVSSAYAMRKGER